jgi:hypothetical protein
MIATGTAANPRPEYERRIARWTADLARGDRTHLIVANLRLAAVAAGVLVAWLAIDRDAFSPAWIAVPAIVFFALVVVHARVLQRNERAARARDLYRRGLLRIDGTWMGAGPDGSRFLGDHLYARDLDLFGSGSLFQLLNVARTEAGEETLAAWLSGPAAVEEIHARQAAVAELSAAVDFRERLAVVAAEAHVGRSTAIGRWAALPAVGVTLRIAAVHTACGLMTATLVIAALQGAVSTQTVIGWVIVQFAVVAQWRHRVAEVLRRIDRASDDLAVFRQLLETVEGVSFSAPRLAALHAALVSGGVKPSRRIARLERFVSLLNQYQHNPYVRFLAIPLLVQGPLAAGIDRWHDRNGADLRKWLESIGELEALASLATFAYEHPADPFPEISTGIPTFDATALAHPLLTSAAVANDVRLGGGGPQLLVVSGSNMSGKSTLLRSVGVNTVLALAGGPVRASRLVLSPVALGATIKVEDSLQAGHSRFYTEILRIRAIVKRAGGVLPLLFLLDEILHGTNSYDRRIGAEAIVRALVAAGGIGLITTHDLALTSLVDTLGGKAANVHFSDRIEDGNMVFDFRMRPGVVEHSNALALMRAVGLEV